MKRAGNLIDKIADPDNIRLAYWKAQKGKQGKKDVIFFTENLNKNLVALREQLHLGNINIGKYHYFRIYDPKERLICAAPFSERVLQHAIMNICNPVFERFQIFDSYACRKGKGTYAALDRALYFQKKYYFYLKLDVRKYFDTIDHKYVTEGLQRLFKDKKLLLIFKKIIDSFEIMPGKGIPIGNLTSQYFANHVLALADHFIKEKLLVKGYVRYMDDMVLWDNDKKNLLRCGKIIKKYIHDKLGQDIKPFCLNYSHTGLSFLGYRILKSKIQLAARSKKRYEKKLKQFFTYFNNGIWSENEFQHHYLPLLAFVNHADSLGYRKSIMKKYNKGDNHGL